MRCGSVALAHMWGSVGWLPTWAGFAFLFFSSFFRFFSPAYVAMYVYISYVVCMHLFCAYIYHTVYIIYYLRASSLCVYYTIRSLMHVCLSLFRFVFIYKACPSNSKSCIESLKLT